jgi:hypothetical protein
MGSNLVRKEWVQAGDFGAIQQKVTTALDLIRSIRGS